MILTGQIPPGTRLLQVELSERLGVSRTPLREAIRLLEREGLVRISNRNNTVEVVAFTTAEMKELYELREVLDGLAARLAAKRGVSPEMAAHLRQLLSDMDSVTMDPDDEGIRGKAHLDFHSTIAEVSGNSRLDWFMPIIRVSSQMLIGRMNAARQDPNAHSRLTEVFDESHSDHHAILNAIIDGDARTAENLARRHIRKTYNSWLLKDADGAPETL
jgi:DNA-binding GntR family transcriptional regulator